MESSSSSRRSQNSPSRQPSPRQSSSSSQSRGVRLSSTSQPRSGLQKMVLGLISLGSTLAKPQEPSRRERRRQQRLSDAPKADMRSRSTTIHPATPAAGAVDRSVVPLDPKRRGSTPRQLPTDAHTPRPRSVVEMPRSRSESPTGRSGSVKPGQPKAGQPGGDRHPSNKPHASKAQASKAPTQAGQRRSLPIAAFIQGARLVILGVGVWAIAGTVLSMWNPASRPQQVSQAANNAQADVSQLQALEGTGSNLFATLVQPSQEMTELSARVAPLMRDMPDITPGLYVLDLDNGDFFSLNGEMPFPAASMIKVPILIALFQEVDAGNVQLNEELTLQQIDIATGSGDMQFAGIGTQYSLLETATNMIIHSDNTATNMIIRRLGGIEALNQYFQTWGLQHTVVRNLLPDLEGTNITSPKELSDLLSRLSQGDLVSLKSRDRVLDIMRRTVNNSLLPSTLGEGATISHKTGDIGSAVGDTGLVDLPNGKRYAITAIAKRPFNDDRGYEMVVRLGAVTYDYLVHTSSPSVNAPVDTAPVENAPAQPPTTNSVPSTVENAPIGSEMNHAPTGNMPADPLPGNSVPAAPNGTR